MKSFSCLRRAMPLAFAAILVCGVAGSAVAETQWEATHPRRDEVNDRLQTQDRRINQQRRAGEISAAKARRLHAQDHTMRAEERAMAAPNGGHITRPEQRVLNRQENQVSRAIGQ